MWLLIISPEYFLLRSVHDKVACDMYNLGKMNDSKIKFRTFVLYFTETFSTTNCTFRNKNVYMWGEKIKISPFYSTVKQMTSVCLAGSNFPLWYVALLSKLKKINECTTKIQKYNNQTTINLDEQPLGRSQYTDSLTEFIYNTQNGFLPFHIVLFLK